MKNCTKALVILAIMLFNTTSALANNPTDPNAGVEELVREVFADAPIMVKIFECESGMRQFKNEDQVLISPTRDVGVSQINLKVHAQTARELGFDIYTTEGNLAYARYLYDMRGTRDWYMSRRCWG